MDTLIVIPARVASTRLPNKMLADIGGKPLIVHTWESVISGGFSDVVVACDGREIADAVEQAGGKAVLTSPDLASGTDRVHAAYKAYDKEGKYKFIVNVQGDMPFVEPKLVSEVVELIKNSNYDMATVASTTSDDSYKLDQVVKPVIAYDNENERTGKALYFSRSPIPFGGPFFKHVGIYGFRAESLNKFVSLPQSKLEKSERLEQLRAIENGMTIGIKVLDLEHPISVDTAADLEQARTYFNGLK